MTTTPKLASVLFLAAWGACGSQAAQLAPQAPAPGFDAVSIKESSPGELGPGFLVTSGAVDPTHWQARRLRLGGIIAEAYGLAVGTDRIEGLPQWASTVRFDIDATMPRLTTRAQVRLMLLAMLSNRFKMIARFDNRPMLAATLSVAPHGAKLTPDPGCGRPDDLPALIFPPDSIDKPAAKTAPPPACGSWDFAGGDIGETVFHGATMAQLAFFTRAPGNLPVLDRTGLKGAYDFSLNDPSLAMARQMDGAQRQAAADDLLRAREDAYLKQLGLILTLRNPQRLPVSVVVVDHVEMPTPN